MSTSKHARAVALAEPSDGINGPLEQQGSRRLIGYDPRGAPNGRKHATQHDAIVLVFALLNLREVAHIALLTALEQDGEPLRRGYAAD